MGIVSLLAVGLCLFHIRAALAQTPAFEEKWEEIAALANRLPIQEKCKPQRRSASTALPYRGVVILVHGFSACPPQLDAFATQLNEAGFETFSMLLPGEGRIPKSNGRDDLSAMPDKAHWLEYTDLSGELNDLASRAEGLRIIGGLSVGGAVALQAALEQPGLYDRVILFSPFFDVSFGVVRNLLELSHSVPLFGELLIDGGKMCHQDNAEGRAGTCSFHVKAAQAIQKMGRFIYAHLNPLKQTQLQLVGVTDDDTAYAEDMRSAMNKMGGPTSVSACFFPKEVSHSVISTTDKPHENKWWLPGLLKYSARFVAEGIPIPTGDLSQEVPYRLCDVILDSATTHARALSRN